MSNKRKRRGIANYEEIYRVIYCSVNYKALTPLTVAADSIDTKINESTNKITELKNQKSAE